MREVDKWPKRFKLKRISTLIILICFFLSIAIAALTYYGSNVGNFLITIEDDDIKNMSLDESTEFTNPRSLLSAAGLREMTHATLAHIPEDIDQTDGSHNDERELRYIAYTFYAKNTSELTVIYDFEIVLLEVYNKADSIIRFMLIRNDEEPQIFAKAQEIGDEIGQPEKNLNTKGESLYECINFQSSSTVYSESQIRLMPQSYDKYTIVIWLEGWDPQCIDTMKGGTLKMEMRFEAR